jgi:hypothetical protein
MREDYETERPGATAGTPQFANAGAIQKFPVYSMYKRQCMEEWKCRASSQNFQEEELLEQLFRYIYVH